MNQLNELAHLSQLLNKESDSHSQYLAQLEKYLRQLNLGVETWVVLSESSMSGTPSRDSSRRTYLGYAKTDEGWLFATKIVRVERGYWQGDSDCPWENEYEEEQPKPLLKSSREIRLQAAAMLPRLLDALKENAEETLKALQQANSRLAQA